MITKGYKINDRYQIVRTIGEGGMANVYLAHDTILDRDVAVKVLRGDLADDEKFVRRFQREAISASSLSHPNIVEMYDVGEDNGNYYIVMEYVDGKTLKSLIKRRGALTVSEVIDIMTQLINGIATAHDSYIIHRDIKPQNVMILDNGMVKITDFGIAMALNSNELTQTNSVMGSVHYLPPEQANGSGSTIKSDIYSLGILMYELLTGKLPFKGDNAVEIAIKQMKEPIPSMRKKNPEITQSLENIVLKACAKNPKNRYDNVLQMKDDIEHALDLEHLNDERIVYKYPENDLDETKIMPAIKESKEEIDVEEKKTNRILLIIAAIFGGLISLIGIIVIMASLLTKTPNVEIPDVVGKTQVEAETVLREKGFSVASVVKYKPSGDYDSDIVIGTEPAIGRIIKKGTEITLVVSDNSNRIEIEDYKNQNYFEVKAALEVKGLNVITETKKVEKLDVGTENLILDQSPIPGTVLSKGDTVTLFVQEEYVKYPDFVNEDWTINKIEEFCQKYDLILRIDYVETNEHSEGTILSQSREINSQVTPKASLTIKVAKQIIEDSEEESNE
jgi:serine/threonine-protein kinase